MKRAGEDNTVGIIQRAVRHFKIHVTRSSVKEALKSHSLYPTFKSVCDVLDEWNVEHYPLRYDPGEIKDLATPYIAHFNSGGGQLAFVTGIDNEKVTYFDSYSTKKETSAQDFIKKCSGAVILLNPGDESGEKDYRKKWQEEAVGNSVLPVTIGAVILFIAVAAMQAFSRGGPQPGITPALLLLTKLAGISFSAMLVLHDYEVHLSLTDKLCHLNKATNCNTVLNDKASKIFGWIGWADAGFIYFTGGLPVLLQSISVNNYSLLAILSVLSLPYPVFSVYYQGFVLKKWCPLCLGVQLILIVEFVLLLPSHGHLSFSFVPVYSFVLTFLVVGIIYILINMYFREKMRGEMNYSKYLGFKKNPNVLKALLSGQKFYDIPVTGACLVFGTKDSPVKITAFLSLNCSHCARAFIKIKEALKSGINAGVNIVLVTQDTEVLNTLYHLNRQDKEEEALDLLDQWYDMDPYSRQKIHNTLCIPEVADVSEGVRSENYRLFKECDVSGTPTFFINGYKLPNQYDIDDIKYLSMFFAEKGSIAQY